MNSMFSVRLQRLSASLISLLCSRGTPYVVKALIIAGTVAADIPGLHLRQSGGCNGGIGVRQSVGGISVNTDGVLATATQDDSRQLRDLMKQALLSLQRQDVDIKQPSELRKVSLRTLQDAVRSHLEANQPIPDDIRFLAGLQTIRHVFVYPERKDVVIVGFGEGWKVDDRGFVVGITTGRPVLQLDDLLVALRTVSSARPITCSIDPTQAGVARLGEFVKTLASGDGDRTQLLTNIERQLGAQTISFAGVEPTSHLARVLIAADYRMKRIAMAFDPSPVVGLPSYMNMISAGSRGLSNMMPRWWLTTDYDPLLHDADKLAWELSGRGVKAMSEEDLLKSDGTIERGARQGGPTQRWAELMTAKYAELAVKEPIFGQLRGVMDLTVVAALISRERLAECAGLDLSVLAGRVPVEQYAAATQTPSIAKAVQKGSNLVISASGGVELNPFEVISRQSMSEKLTPVRAQATQTDVRWWWN